MATMRLLIFMLILSISLWVESSAAEPAPPPLTGASLSGFVKDAESGETLIGATVYMPGIKKGARTNKNGYYIISGIDQGKLKVKISYVGYEVLEKEISFSKNQSIRMDFELNPTEAMTEQVTVEAEREIEKRQITMSKINVPVSQMKEIRIGGESDVFRTLQLLPGVLTSSQVSSGLYIRGGSPDQNLVLLDGMTVYNPSHLFGFISTFNSEAIKDVELIKGGYPAEFTSRLSSVVNITQKDGNRNKVGGMASLGLVTSKLSLDGPAPWDGGTWFAGGRITYFDLIRPALDTDPLNPIPDIGFKDLNMKVTQEIGKNDKIFLSGFYSRDDMSFKRPGMDMNMFMGNKAGAFRWNHIFSSDVFSTFLFSTSYYNNGFNQNLSGFDMKIDNSILDFTGKYDVDYFVSDVLTLKTGVELKNYTFKYDQNWTGSSEESEEGTTEGGRLKLKVEDWNYSGYLQGNYQFTDLMSAQAGVRVEHWKLAKKTLIDPRMAFRWQMQEWLAVKASYGKYHQYLRLSSVQDFTLFDTWLPSDTTINPSYADHFILSFETHPAEDLDLNFDVYYKKLHNISEVRNDQLEGSTVSDVFYEGEGEAYGFEVFLQKRVGKIAGWIGYGFGFVNAKFEKINNGNTFNPKYDRRHDFKAVLQYDINDTWDVGAQFQMQSGQPYTGSSSRFNKVMYGEGWGKGMTFPTDRYGLRLPMSHQLNVYGSYTTTMFGLPFRVILDVYNVYSRRDILQRQYSVDGEDTIVEDIKLLPILPTFSFELKF